MSPEQAEGKAVGPRSDPLALGVIRTNWRRASGRFKGIDGVVAVGHSARHAAAVTDTRPTLPPELARIVRRCLEKDPARRLQTALDLRNELEEIQAALPAATTPLADREADAGVKPRPVGIGSGRSGECGAAAPARAPCRRGRVGARRSHRFRHVAMVVCRPPGARLIRSPCSRSRTRAAAPTRIIWLTASPKRSRTALRRLGRCGWSPEQRPRTIEIRRWIRARPAGASSVRAIVTASVVQRGDQLTVQVHLIDTASVAQLWGDQFNRPLSEALALQGEISKAVADPCA